MAGLALSSLRVGHEYTLKNYGETFHFEVMKLVGKADLELKDLYTLEKYTMHELLKYGKGSDFEIRELNE